MMIIMPLFPLIFFLMYYYLAHIVLMLSTCCAMVSTNGAGYKLACKRLSIARKKCLHKYSLISIKKK